MVGHPGMMGTLVREGTRALMSPVRLLASLPGQQQRRAAAQALLAQPPESETDDLQRFLAALPPPQLHTGPQRVFLSTGELSGESHGLALMAAVERAGVQVEWSGFGGQRLAAAGCHLLADLVDRASTWLWDSIKQVPFFTGVFRRFVTHLDNQRPDLVVLVDYPGFHLVLAEAAHRRGIPVLYFITPQYWGWGGWRSGRAPKSLS
jgi:hypothetical protein